MALSYTVKDGTAILKDGTKKIDEVGSWLTDEEAEAWASAVCDKYNSAEYAGYSYPEEKPRESIPAE
jgi:hypothetical protein